MNLENIRLEIENSDQWADQSQSQSQKNFRESAYQRFLPIHQKALALARNLERCEFEMIEILQVADRDGGYRILNFKSLFQYANVGLALPPDRAYMFITVARKAARLSLMQEALKTGDLKLSKAKKIASVITKENQKEWLDRAKNLSQRVLERMIAKADPKSKVEEGMKFISENMLEFRAAIDLDAETKIKRVQDLLSQSLGRAATYNDVIKTMAQEYINSKDPVVRADRILKKKLRTEVKTTEAKPTEAKKTKVNELAQEAANVKSNAHAQIYKSHAELANQLSSAIQLTNPRSAYQAGLHFAAPGAQLKRQPLSRELKHRVFQRDQGQCQERYQAGICGESRWIDVHHLIPVSQGGQNVLENLITLCWAHHRMEHLE